MTIQLRPGVSSDLPAIAGLDMAAHYKNPLVTIPFVKASDCQAAFLDRYTYFFNNPECHFVLATSEEEIVGFMVWRKPDKEEQPKWEPKLPEGTNMNFLGALLSASDKDKARYSNDGLYELEALAVSPTQQRRGIGSLLLEEFVKILDVDHEGSFINSSAVGKPVYEKLGWKVRGEFHFDLSEYGREEELVSYSMKRDAMN